MVAAIPTTYNGIKFRSRLEARWALLLDAMSVPWQYEAEGFNLPSGFYLPDFWLPEQESWLEIKPPFDVEYDRERERFERAQSLCGELAVATGKRVILAASNFGDWIRPEWANQRGMVAFFPRPDGGGFDMDTPYLPARCPTCGRFGFVYEGRGGRICVSGCSWRDVDVKSVDAAIGESNAHAFWNPRT